PPVVAVPVVVDVVGVVVWFGFPHGMQLLQNVPVPCLATQVPPPDQERQSAFWVSEQTSPPFTHCIEPPLHVEVPLKDILGQLHSYGCPITVNVVPYTVVCVY